VEYIVEYIGMELWQFWLGKDTLKLMRSEKDFSYGNWVARPGRCTGRAFASRLSALPTFQH